MRSHDLRFFEAEVIEFGGVSRYVLESPKPSEALHRQTTYDVANPTAREERPSGSEIPLQRISSKYIFAEKDEEHSSFLTGIEVCIRNESTGSATGPHFPNLLEMRTTIATLVDLPPANPSQNIRLTRLLTSNHVPLEADIPSIYGCSEAEILRLEDAIKQLKRRRSESITQLARIFKNSGHPLPDEPGSLQRHAPGTAHRKSLRMLDPGRLKYKPTRSYLLSCRLYDSRKFPGKIFTLAHRVRILLTEQYMRLESRGGF
ncbi:hypothetical protein B0H13DRAFT_1912861 [Mycena leptocephala]|nr:hypothetical protein B0H13DRAFT_1912861 [Mycena leptocephala]